VQRSARSFTLGVGSLVGDKLYVFPRDGGDEVLRCLEAATGKELAIGMTITRGSSALLRRRYHAVQVTLQGSVTSSSE